MDNEVVIIRPKKERLEEELRDLLNRQEAFDGGSNAACIMFEQSIGIVEDALNSVDAAIRLYSPYSSYHTYGMPGFVSPLVNRHTEWYWCCRNRRQPIAPYNEVIKDYDKLSVEDKLLSERLVDEMFTVDEVDALAEYVLQCEGLVLDKNEVPLPVQFDLDYCRPLYSEGLTDEEYVCEMKYNDQSGGITLCRQQRDVLTNAFIYLTKDQESAATELIEEVLRKMNVPTPRDLRWLINTVCGQNGLAVVPKRDENGMSTLLRDREATQEAWDSCGATERYADRHKKKQEECPTYSSTHTPASWFSSDEYVLISDRRGYVENGPS